MKTFGLVLGFLSGFMGLALGKLQLGSQEVKPATLERFDGACLGHNVPMIYELLGTQTEGTNLVLNTTLTVNEDISTDPTLLISIKRCKSKENLDSCEHFQDFKTTKLCALVQARSGMWSSFFKSFTPECKCPFKQGVYRGLNSKIDFAAMVILTGGDWVWQSNVTLLEKRTNRVLMCMVTVADVTSRIFH